MSNQLHLRLDDKMITINPDDQYAMFDAKVKKILKKGHDRILIYHEGINALTILETKAKLDHKADRIILDNDNISNWPDDGWCHEASNFKVMSQSIYRGIYFTILGSWKS